MTLLGHFLLFGHFLNLDFDIKFADKVTDREVFQIGHEGRCLVLSLVVLVGLAVGQIHPHVQLATVELEGFPVLWQIEKK